MTKDELKNPSTTKDEIKEFQKTLREYDNLQEQVATLSPAFTPREINRIHSRNVNTDTVSTVNDNVNVVQPNTISTIYDNIIVQPETYLDGNFI